MNIKNIMVLNIALCPHDCWFSYSSVWNDEELPLTGLHPWHHIHVLSPGKKRSGLKPVVKKFNVTAVLGKQNLDMPLCVTCSELLKKRRKKSVGCSGCYHFLRDSIISSLILTLSFIQACLSVRACLLKLVSPPGLHEPALPCWASCVDPRDQASAW